MALLSLVCFVLSATGSIQVQVLPPVEPPLVQNRPFVVIWNAPTERCQRLGIPLDTAAFQAVTTPNAVPRQFLTIFYEDRLGLYPKVDTDSRHIYRGGVPQNGNLRNHLAKARHQISRSIAQDSAPGLAVIDWESWRPLWEQNWGSKRIYQRLSINHALQMAPFLSSREISKVAKEQFQQAGRRFMERTISLGVGERPSRRWGFYLFPDCHNYGWSRPGYTGRCSARALRQNNQMKWLWEHSTALFPSVYLHQSLRDSVQAALFVRYRVLEALRVAALPRRSSMMPVYVYSRPLYRDQTKNFESATDLVSTIGESAAVGASGVILWGGTRDYNNKVSCEALSEYLASTLSPYVANVTAAATLCSQVLCQSKGRCVRREYNSTQYLQLNAASFNILRTDRKYVAVGRPSSADLDVWVQNFRCQCFAGCSCSARLQPPASIRRIWV